MFVGRWAHIRFFVFDWMNQILGLGSVFSQNLIRAKRERMPRNSIMILRGIDGCNTQMDHLIILSGARSETDPDA